MKLHKSCINCIRAVTISVNSDLLCSIHGPVTTDYVCSKHKLLPAPKSQRDLNTRCIQCEHFIISTQSLQAGRVNFGLCKLFSVREFDGTKKNACSKYIKNSEADVS